MEPFVALLWDRETRSGMVARDQLGGRALYYLEDRAGRLVGCEVQDLRAASDRSTGPTESRWLTGWRDAACPRTAPCSKACLVSEPGAF